MINISELLQKRLQAEKEKTKSLLRKKNRPYVFVDGFNVFLRSFLVNQDVTNKSEPCGGVSGFLRSIDHLIDMYSPEKVFVVWETGGGSQRRKAMFSEYKTGRAKLKEMSGIQGSGSMKDTIKDDQENRIKQLTMLSNLLKATAVCQVFVKDVECDDIVAYLVKTKYRNEERKKIIVSSDKDFYQLLDREDVFIHDPATKNLVDGKKVKERYNIAPRNFCLAKAIVGDESDNIPGVYGAGFKTIAKRFPEFADENSDLNTAKVLETAKIKINEIKKPPKIYSDMITNVDLVIRNWSSMYLDVGIMSANQISKIDYVVDNHEPQTNKMTFIKLLLEYGITLSWNVDNFI